MPSDYLTVRQRRSVPEKAAPRYLVQRCDPTSPMAKITIDSTSVRNAKFDHICHRCWVESLQPDTSVTAILSSILRSQDNIHEGRG
jgi:hypothetical protein